MDVSNRKRSLREENTASPEKKPRLAMYLEDYTPVRTIEVNNVPTDLREDLCLSYLLGFFERDGPVEHVEIVKKTENEWLAYVTFVVPDDAARLICNKNVPGYCRSSKFTIKEAEHEHQPKLDPNVLNLEGVNDHCLLKIMSHLQLIDIINLGKTSTRMQSVTQMFYEKYAHFSFGSITGDSSINETNLPVILEVLGSYIRSIDWHHLNASQFECLAKYCPNVTKIKMSFVKKDLSTAILNRHKQFFANLKQLSIESAPYLYDGNLKSMMSGNKLITLDMNRCLKLRGKFINTRNRAKLRNIRIVDCTGMDDATCFSIAEWKNKLITFTFNKCCSYLHYLSLPPESMGELKELQLDFTCFKGDVEGLNFSGLTKLKKLTLTRNNHLVAVGCNNMIKALIQIDTLESLNIQAIKIDYNTIENLRSIKNLKYLRMDQVENTIGRNLYQSLPVNLSTLQEFSISFMTAEAVTAKLLYDDLVMGMPKMSYFSHSSITWELLDAIVRAKPEKLLDQRSFLKIGVSKAIFDNPKKETFDANNLSGITLSIHE